MKAEIVSDYRGDLNLAINSARQRGLSNSAIIRSLFYFRRSPISHKHESSVFDIFDDVSLHFEVPFKNIYLSGSAQTGHSLHKNRDFSEGESDLDLAIVDTNLFKKYSEICYSITDGYRNLTKFKTRRSIDDVPSFFRENLSRGFFRPDLMPNCKERDDWFRYFDQLSTAHVGIFKSVNCGIYLSQVFFEHKLTKVLEAYRSI